MSPLPQARDRAVDDTASSRLSAFLARQEPELLRFRRDLHAHPELGRQERRTTERLVEQLEAAGLVPKVLPHGCGVICDIDPIDDDGPIGAELSADSAHRRGRLAIRADIDALPVQEAEALPFRSTVTGVSHACGHDVHTACALGAGLFLAEEARAGRLPRGVRLVFQPAEELLPGGAVDMVDAGALDGVASIIGVHCDPKVDAGQIGLRTGALTAACDTIELRMSGPGGHTARPHLTVDIVYALAAMVTELPAALSRRMDPRGGVSVVWGQINAGHASNAIPQYGEVRGTLRAMDQRAWSQAPDLIHELVDSIAAVYGAKTEMEYVRGVPPVVNEEHVVELLREAAHRALSVPGGAGPDGIVAVEQSMGGEDFSWYLQHVPGAMARLGVRTPGDPTPRDLHQSTFVADEAAIAVGVRLFAEAAMAADHARV
ncbi:MAG TPA: amidohydrolase [Actinocrinis sp.]|uniref:amidohydrolase n=1 Tax=Actinocrinis sp. TaxID=1920516 RepID=UPI002DE26A1C|nr:amidohydrolase [Actinocrinis sp.]